MTSTNGNGCLSIAEGLAGRGSANSNSRELPDAPLGAIGFDPANSHDCVGQATSTITVGLSGCERYLGTGKGSNTA